LENVYIKIFRPHLQLELISYKGKISSHFTEEMTHIRHDGQLQLFFTVLFRQLQKFQVILVLDSQLCLALILLWQGFVKIGLS